MSQPIHTPGPIVWDSGPYSLHNDKGESILEACQGTVWSELSSDSAYIDCSEPNARLLAAAYNAFDSAATKLNCNAVELAERMADGGLAQLVEGLDQLKTASCGVAGCLEEDAPSLFRYFEQSLERASAILAKVRGDAA